MTILKTDTKYAYELEPGANLVWFGNIYTILSKEVDEFDDTVLWMLGYPRHLDKGYPLLDRITCPLNKAVNILKS